MVKVPSSDIVVINDENDVVQRKVVRPWHRESYTWRKAKMFQREVF